MDKATAHLGSLLHFEFLAFVVSLVGSDEPAQARVEILHGGPEVRSALRAVVVGAR